MCIVLCLSATALAQKAESRSSLTSPTTDSSGSPRLQTEPSVQNAVEARPRVVGNSGLSESSNANIKLNRRFDQLLLAAIQEHLGSVYHFGGTGPDTFDCSGFVWRTYQEAGFNFTRGPARSYWATMPAATREEEGKFGTLVFFSGLAHVGIVADEHGFYHASRHHGVIYSPFNDYWLARIDGFRRVPLNELKPSTVNEKATSSKASQRPVTGAATNGGMH